MRQLKYTLRQTKLNARQFMKDTNLEIQMLLKKKKNRLPCK